MDKYTPANAWHVVLGTGVLFASFYGAGYVTGGELTFFNFAITLLAPATAGALMVAVPRWRPSESACAGMLAAGIIDCMFIWSGGLTRYHGLQFVMQVVPLLLFMMATTFILFLAGSLLAFAIKGALVGNSQEVKIELAFFSSLT